MPKRLAALSIGPNILVSDEHAASDPTSVTEPPLPDDVRGFLTRSVESYEEVEIALFLRGRLGVALTAGEVAEELRTTDDAALRALLHLRDAGVVASIDNDRGRQRFRFEPRTPEVAETLRRLSAVYAPMRLEIMRLLTTSAIDRVRFAAARSLADGFLWGGRKGDG